MDIELKFNYGNDIERIKKTLQESIHGFEHMPAEPASRIGVSAIEQDRYTMCVNVWVETHGFYDKRLLLNEKIIADLVAAGIKLPGM